MGVYRKQIEIVGDILYAAEELTIDQEGASITNLIQKANNRIEEVKSGKKVFDWKVPNEWNVKNAWVKNSKGKMCVNKIELNPKIVFEGDFSVSSEEMDKMQGPAIKILLIIFLLF